MCFIMRSENERHSTPTSISNHSRNYTLYGRFSADLYDKFIVREKYCV